MSNKTIKLKLANQTGYIYPKEKDIGVTIKEPGEFTRIKIKGHNRPFYVTETPDEIWSRRVFANKGVLSW